VNVAAFYVLAALTVAAASGVVFLRNPVHCAMSLVAALFLIAISYMSLQAHLVAALQIIVYAGAVMILFLFVIMLLNLQSEAVPESHVGQKVVGAIAAAAVAFLLARTVVAGKMAVIREPHFNPEFGTTQAVARMLFREHVVAFELTSLLLLVAVVGAIVLARRDR
jgi:NADH-quinone oxidoreductase subunit J